MPGELIFEGWIASSQLVSCAHSESLALEPLKQLRKLLLPWRGNDNALSGGFPIFDLLALAEFA